MTIQPRTITQSQHSAERNALLSNHAYHLPPFPCPLRRSNNKFTLQSPSPQKPTSATSNYERLTLSASPASSASSSTSGSLALEDERIKRIFSNDPVDSRLTPQFHSSVVWVRKLARSPWANPSIPPPRDVLNSSKRAFTPTLNPILDDLLPSLPSPFDLEPSASTFLHPPTVQLPSSPPPTPDYPPGLPHPPQYKHLVGIKILKPELPHTLDDASTAANSATLIQRALNPEILEWHRDLIANRIVTSSAWTAYSVTELAELICFEACQSSQDPGVVGQEVPVCSQERYWPISTTGVDQPHRSESRAQAAALLGRDLSHQLSAWCGEEVSQAFMKCLREKILQTFLRHWDSTIESSINYFPIPSTHRVRSAISVSTAVAALYVQNFISTADISMCINVLLSALKSIEHAEALGNIVIGCGQRYWASTPAVTANSLEMVTHSTILKRHVGEFLFGLEVNCDIYRLDDSKSVVNRPWGQGQLMSRLHEVANSVKAWEVDLQAQMYRQMGTVAHHAM